jgi:peptidoglycan/LPS O-acetylase OafA/YrhL
VTSFVAPEQTLSLDDIPPPETGRSTEHRLNGLDGFRALAVAVVMLYHFKVGGFSGGWIGPELFFVLSGYLITTLLLDRSDPESYTLSLRDFWTRRIKRLYPAVIFLVAVLISVVAILAALGSISVATISPSGLSSESFAALAYYANWHLISEHVGYFGQSTSLLKHTWSLAIEEQFYVVFPLIFVCIRRWKARWRSVGLVVAGLGAIASAVDAAVTVSPSSINLVYYSTQTNAYHLLVGVFLAFASHSWIPTPRTRRILEVLAAPALVVVMIFVETASDSLGGPRLWMFRGGGVVLDLAAGALLLSLVFGTHRSWVSRAFNLRPVVWIGSISYGLYLWHYPLAVLMTPVTTHLSQYVLVPILIASTIGLAAFSFHFVEVVVRESLIAERRARWAIFGAGIAGTVTLVASASWLIRL